MSSSIEVSTFLFGMLCRLDTISQDSMSAALIIFSIPRWKVADLQNLGVHFPQENSRPHNEETVCDRTHVSGALIGNLPFSQSQCEIVTQ